MPASGPASPWSSLLRDNLNADEVANFLSSAIARKESTLLSNASVSEAATPRAVVSPRRRALAPALVEGWNAPSEPVISELMNPSLSSRAVSPELDAISPGKQRRGEVSRAEETQNKTREEILGEAGVGAELEADERVDLAGLGEVLQLGPDRVRRAEALRALPPQELEPSREGATRTAFKPRCAHRRSYTGSASPARASSLLAALLNNEAPQGALCAEVDRMDRHEVD